MSLLSHLLSAVEGLVMKTGITPILLPPPCKLLLFSKVATHPGHILVITTLGMLWSPLTSD